MDSELPGAGAHVDDQKDGETCSLYSLSKAICNGFETQKFRAQNSKCELIKLDLDQKHVQLCLLNKLGPGDVLNARHPTDFTGKIFAIVDNKNDTYNTSIMISRINPNDFMKDRNLLKRYEHLIVVRVKSILNDSMLKNLDLTGEELHSLYVQDYNEKKQEVSCVNSWGQDNNPYPSVSILETTHIYEVEASAVPASFQKEKESEKEPIPETKNDDSKEEADKIDADPKILDKILEDWNDINHYPSLEEISSAAYFASEGVLPKVKFLKMKNLDLTNLDNRQLEELSMLVTNEIHLSHVKGTFTAILGNLVCDKLTIDNLLLNKSDTSTLASLLQNKINELYIGDGVILAIDSILHYAGSGKCCLIVLKGDSKTRYGDQFTEWAEKFGWIHKEMKITTILWLYRTSGVIQVNDQLTV